jgi:adenosyl cobinamide kinase/adenosyl cobinamide phosphate guanylyltransferase
MANMTWSSPEIEKEMEELIQKARKGNENVVFDDCVNEWVNLCLDSLGLLGDSDIEAESQGLVGVAREIYDRLTSSSLG